MANNHKGFVSVLILTFVAVLLISGILLLTTTNLVQNQKISEKLTIFIPSPSPTPYQFPYANPRIEKARSYRTIIVGDSIVESLGANANLLREKLIEYYPDSEFVNYNYGYGSTNIESLPARLIEMTKKGTEEYPPILEQGFELIIIESFAYNPLSHLELEEGLHIQNEMLEKSVEMILREKPNSALAFMTPIAPSPGDFGKGVVDLSPEQRSFWANERIKYIENHKKFADGKGIPVIDVYKASLMENGLVDNKFISNDFIHPSSEGIALMSQEIADYIFENKIFPE